MNYRAHFFALVMLTLVGCGSTVKAPFQPPEPEWALTAADSGPLSDMEHQALGQPNLSTESVDPMAEGHSAFKLLDRSEDALRWRLALIDSATQSIDLQYYLFHSDSSGLLVTRRLLDAADRGVRVRIIIDDMGTLAFKPSQKKLRDAMAAVMIAHPNISFRLFNSAPNRSALGRGWDFATEFEQLNHRMHNKSLTVDNRATVVGGRNIGDEYMGLDSHFNFRDLDILGIGPVARQTSKIFDLFWNGSWVMSPNAAIQSHAEAEFDQQKTAIDVALKASPVLERFSLLPRDWAAEFAALLPSLHVGSSEVRSDRPGKDGFSHDLFDWITETLPKTETELLVTNAYLIPEASGVKILENLADAGVEVIVHTNSLASQDVPAVNSHYKKMRAPILRAGASLYEARTDASIKHSVVDTYPVAAKYMGLHAKSMVIDRRYSVIGSANFDPRSAFLNSEMIAIIDSEGLAEELMLAIRRDISAANSWEVTLDQEGKLSWRHDTEVTRRQPAKGLWQRIQDTLFTLFPKRLY